MEALNVILSGISTGCSVVKTNNVRLPAKEGWRISLYSFNRSIQPQRRIQSKTMYSGNCWTCWQAKKSSAQRWERTNYATSNFNRYHGTPQPLSQFLQEPAGMKSMLNTDHLEDFEYLGENVFRCYLPEISALGQKVAPVLDLLVYATETECVVEMIACKFGAPEASGDKGDRFSANLKNHLQWKYGENGELLLRANLNIDVSIEVHTLPFTMLPLTAVETPGNAVLQAIVDRTVPVFMQQLLLDYSNWVKERPQDQLVADIYISPENRNSEHKRTDGIAL